MTRCRRGAGPRVPADPYRALRAALRAAAPGLARDLPWAGADPWGVLVSEVMLQQTPAARVAPRWAAFVARYPDPAALARAPLGDVLGDWAGLGYPRRARDLRAAAALIVERHGGRVPSDRADLRALPGVGEYTAAAVASFAFGERVAAIDTNVGRVLARAAANRRLSAADAREVAARLLPRAGAPAFNQALIDLGARHCRPAPRCAQCPVARACAWRRAGGTDPAPSSHAVSRPQARYAGSDREMRGRVLRALGDGARTREVLGGLGDPERVARAVESLRADGLVESRGRRVALAR